MKKLILTLACMALVSATAYSQTQSLSFNDNVGTANAGTYASTDTITVDINVTLHAGYNSIGLSYWLEAQNSLAAFISVTGDAYGTTFPNFNQVSPNPAFFTNATDSSSGFMSENRDLGSTINDTSTNTNGVATNAIAPGTYLAGTLTLALSGLAPGTYTLQVDPVSAHNSQVSDDTFGSHNVAATTYTITVVPEPAIWSLFALGGLGAFGLNLLRARRRS